MFGLAVVALLVGGEATAQPRNPYGGGTRIPAFEEQQVDQASRLEAFRVVQRMGECLVKADPTNSMAYATAVAASSESEEIFGRLKPRLSSCLAGAAQGTDLYGELTLQVTPRSLRGAISGALYRLQFASRVPASLPKPRFVAPIMPPEKSEDRYSLVAYAFAQCLTGMQPDSVRQFVLSKAGSSDENAALERLKPSMPHCATTGTTIKTDRNTLRLMLAESLYRWSVAAAHEATDVAGATSVKERGQQ